MAIKKSSTRRIRAARTTTGATKPMKTTAKLQRAAVEPQLVQATSTPTEIVHAGLMALRHRLQARPGAGAAELDAVLARLAADYARVLGRV